MTSERAHLAVLEQMAENVYSFLRKADAGESDWSSSNLRLDEGLGDSPTSQDLKAVLEKGRTSKTDDNGISPLQDARFYCDAGYDKDGFSVKYLSDYKGFGVITTKAFKKGDFLLEYVGERISAEEAGEREKKNVENKMFFYTYKGRKLCMDAEGITGHICQWVNDASDASCNAVMMLKVFGTIERLCLFAKKDIAKGEEITYNYGDKEGNLWWRKKEHMSADKFSYDSDGSDPFGLDSYVPNSDENESDSECDEMTVICDEDSKFSTISDIIPQQMPPDRSEMDSVGKILDSTCDPTFPQKSVCQDRTDCGETPLPIPDKENRSERKSQKPDRFCVYCKEIVKNGKLRRHIRRKHAKIPEVENILKKEKEIQNQFFDEKRKEGISEYNLSLISENKDPVMRERKPVSEDKLRTCAECKGYYSNKYFYKHKCKSDNPTAIKPALLQKVKKSKMDSDSEFQDILNRFVDGEVGDLIRKSTEIQIVGYKHFNMRRHEEGKADEVRKVVMSDMRELARLYLTFTEIIGEEKTFEDMFTREHLQDLADAIQKMVTRTDKTEKYGLKLLLDAIILRAIKTLMGYFSETIQDEKKKKLKVYLEAYKYKSSELFPKARQACVKQSIKKSRRPANLPCEKNLQKLQYYIHNNIEKIVQNFDLKDYKHLRTLVVSRLTLFNARRGEEAPRMLLSEWDAAEKNVWLPDEQIQTIKDEAEKFLVGQFKLCYILGKGKKFVPVLIPKDIVPGIRLLVKERANYNIPESNNFVFATAKRTSHCSGWHALSEVCSAAGVEIPITATGMRHRLSTIYASLNMPAEQKKIFLEHMGHEEQINEDNYQCPRGVQAVKLMGKILKTVEQGSSATTLEDVAADVEQTSNISERETPMANDQSNKTVSGCDDDRPTKKRRLSVHWSEKDNKTIKSFFKDWIVERKESNKGSLPSKEKILDFISSNHLESIEELTLGEQYWKIRTKLFNERKTMREKSCSKLKEITMRK